ncbi:hypothetical protein RCL1_004468 [Eukaryota sp. TZLM3-RCL]
MDTIDLTTPALSTSPAVVRFNPCFVISLSPLESCCSISYFCPLSSTWCSLSADQSFPFFASAIKVSFDLLSSSKTSSQCSSIKAHVLYLYKSPPTTSLISLLNSYSILSFSNSILSIKCLPLLISCYVNKRMFLQASEFSDIGVSFCQGNSELKNELVLFSRSKIYCIIKNFNLEVLNFHLFNSFMKSGIDPCSPIISDWFPLDYDLLAFRCVFPIFFESFNLINEKIDLLFNCLEYILNLCKLVLISDFPFEFVESLIRNIYLLIFDLVDKFSTLSLTSDSIIFLKLSSIFDQFHENFKSNFQLYNVFIYLFSKFLANFDYLFDDLKNLIFLEIFTTKVSQLSLEKLVSIINQKGFLTVYDSINKVDVNWSALASSFSDVSLYYFNLFSCLGKSLSSSVVFDLIDLRLQSISTSRDHLSFQSDFLLIVLLLLIYDSFCDQSIMIDCSILSSLCDLMSHQCVEDCRDVSNLLSNYPKFLIPIFQGLCSNKCVKILQSNIDDIFKFYLVSSISKIDNSELFSIIFNYFSSFLDLIPSSVEDFVNHFLIECVKVLLTNVDFVKNNHLSVFSENLFIKILNCFTHDLIPDSTPIKSSINLIGNLIFELDLGASFTSVLKTRFQEISCQIMTVITSSIDCLKMIRVYTEVINRFCRFQSFLIEFLTLSLSFNRDQSIKLIAHFLPLYVPLFDTNVVSNEILTPLFEFFDELVTDFSEFLSIYSKITNTLVSRSISISLSIKICNQVSILLEQIDWNGLLILIHRKNILKLISHYQSNLSVEFNIELSKLLKKFLNRDIYIEKMTNQQKRSYNELIESIESFLPVSREEELIKIFNTKYGKDLNPNNRINQSKLWDIDPPIIPEPIPTKIISKNFENDLIVLSDFDDDVIVINDDVMSFDFS